jgi:sarcosine oxidase/L-pipecolate oxidase
MDKDTRIIIIGGGCFGISTAYHLAQRGYTSIRALDRYPPPSCEAISTDISKIIRSDYNEPLYARLGIESIAAWRSWSLFSGLYHVSGGF